MPAKKKAKKKAHNPAEEFGAPPRKSYERLIDENLYQEMVVNVCKGGDPTLKEIPQLLGVVDNIKMAIEERISEGTHTTLQVKAYHGVRDCLDAVRNSLEETATFLTKED